MGKIWWIVFAVGLLAGCVTTGGADFPPCPLPSSGVADQVSDLIFYEEGYDDLIEWVSEIDRYCRAVDKARD
ncbi:MAG: hypothetical protein CME21_21440 [Gemmatimonadetes bacterium]|nr:hypothetical protein [Gemmatimonadota bacterium]